MPSFATTINPQLATTVAKALAETGNTSAHEAFVAAITWPIVPLASGPLPVTVTPEVTAAMLALVNGGQLAALVTTGVSSQQILVQAMEWQGRLSTPEAAP